MTPEEQLKEIIEETCELVRRSAHPTRGTVQVSPEVAATLQRFNPAPAAPTGEAKETTPAPQKPAKGGLDGLAEEVSGCTQCGLSATRTQTVFGDGSPTADLVFVGEAPGADEDREGIPFVGRAGQLLTKIIEDGMKIPRREVYICNVLKCRPPGNRDPNPEEVQYCEPYLIQQLKFIQPKVICALGRHAAQTLLRSTESTGKLRGQWHSYHGIPLRVTYHPAYLLRSPGEKRKTWEDIQEVMKVLNGEVTPDI
jgi:DNA polymerase